MADLLNKLSDVVQDSFNSLSPKIAIPLAAYGAYKAFETFIVPPTIGFLKHAFRPRRNLIERYFSNWALISGGSDGIGEKICHELAKSGFNIVLLARNLEKLEKVSNSLKE